MLEEATAQTARRQNADVRECKGVEQIQWVQNTVRRRNVWPARSNA
jgi:hypothetical protein